MAAGTPGITSQVKHQAQDASPAEASHITRGKHYTLQAQLHSVLPDLCRHTRMLLKKASAAAAASCLHVSWTVPLADAGDLVVIVRSPLIVLEF